MAAPTAGGHVSLPDALLESHEPSVRPRHAALEAAIDGRDDVLLLKAWRGGGSAALDAEVRQHCKWCLEQPCVLQPANRSVASLSSRGHGGAPRTSVSRRVLICLRGCNNHRARRWCHQRPSTSTAASFRP